jgi:hypothetical protein
LAFLSIFIHVYPKIVDSLWKLVWKKAKNIFVFIIY